MRHASRRVRAHTHLALYTQTHTHTHHTHTHTHTHSLTLSLSLSLSQLSVFCARWRAGDSSPKALGRSGARALRAPAGPTVPLRASCRTSAFSLSMERAAGPRGQSQHRGASPCSRGAAAARATCAQSSAGSCPASRSWPPVRRPRARGARPPSGAGRRLRGGGAESARGRRVSQSVSQSVDGQNHHTEGHKKQNKQHPPPPPPPPPLPK